MAENFKPCSVNGCNANASWSAGGTRGLCCAHYKRLRRHGDPLGGQPSRAKSGAPMEWLLQHKNHGGDDCLIWPFGTRKDGRAKLRNESAYRVMCKLVNGPPPSRRHQAAHSCGKGHEGCVNPRHLRWDTALGNQMDRKIHGTHNRGVRNRNCQLSEDDVREIRRLRGTMFQYEIAEKFGITQGAVNKIHTRRTWGWLD